jgi:N-glycosylase/DNA lyase
MKVLPIICNLNIVVSIVMTQLHVQQVRFWVSQNFCHYFNNREDKPYNNAYQQVISSSEGNTPSLIC